jgi:hypothetical protein
MAIVSSGAVSLGDIQTEFGGTNPASLSEYYSKGNAPASGEIQLAADFYGTSNSVSLNFATTFTGTINNGTSITIGTARSTRMVHIMGYFTNNTVPPSSGSIGGVSMTLLPSPSGVVLSWWQGWAKVPTGTSASVTLNTGGGTCFVSTFDTVNSGASNTGIINTGTSGGTQTFNFTVANEGVVFWEGNSGAGQVHTLTLTTDNPGGVNQRYHFTAAGGNNAQTKGAYSLTSTNDSRAFNSIASSGSKGSVLSSGGSVFHAN